MKKILRIYQLVLKVHTMFILQERDAEFNYNHERSAATGALGIKKSRFLQAGHV